MINSGQDDITSQISWVRTIIALFGFLLALVALAGNALHQDILGDCTTYGSHVKNNAALCLGLVSLSLYLLPRSDQGARTGVLVFSALACGLGGLTLSEWLLNWDAGIDQLIFPKLSLDQDSLAPGRMSSNAAAAFLFLGGSGILGCLLKDKRASQALAFIALGISLLSLAGNTFKAASLAHFGTGTLITLPMATALLLVSSAVLIAFPGEGFAEILVSSSLGGTIARRLLPATVVFPLLGLVVMLTGLAGNAENGLLLLVTVNCLALPIFVCLVARAINGLELQRLVAQESAIALQLLNTEVKDLYEHAPCGYHCLSTDGLILSMNETELDWLGYTSTELVDKVKFSQLLAPHSQKCFASSLENLHAGQYGAMELELVRKDGSMLPVMLNSTVVCKNRVETASIRSIVFDISQMRQAQDERARLAAIVSSSQDAITGKTLDGTITSWNAAAEKLYGYSAEEMIGHNVRLLLPQDRIHEVDLILENLRQGKSIEHYESVRLRKDGRFVNVSLAISPIRASDGSISGASTIARDISEQKEALELFRSLLDGSPDAIIVSNEEGTITMVSKQAELTFGYNREELLGQKVEILLPERLRGQHVGHRQKYFQFPETRMMGDNRELLAQHKDGSTFPVEIALSPLKVPGGLLITSAVRDISERKRIEKALVVLTQQLQERTTQLESINMQLQQARDEAVAASKFKTQFLASMSHEIRTPMNGVLGMTELLLKSGLNERQFGYALTIQESGTSLLQVINDILDLTKIEAGKLVLHNEDFDLVRLVESAGELLAAQASKKRLRFSFYVDPKIPPMLTGCAGRIRQVLINLVGNAIKFSGQGSVSVRAVLEPPEKEQAESLEIVWIRFSVCDQGSGLSPEQINQLFQPFMQFDTSMTRAYDSSGLGLSISKNLIELMGGEIGVNSVKDVGTTFWFRLPLKPCLDVQAICRFCSDLKNARVLVVDDDPTTRDIIHNYVLSWGMRNGMASNAQDAMAMLRQAAAADDAYAVAIVDLVMPGTHGLELAALIRGDKALEQTRLILITAFDQPDTAELAKKHGFHGYLTKPVRQSPLFDCISTVLKKPELLWRQTGSTTVPRVAKKRKESLLVVEDHPTNQEVALLLLRDLGFDAHIAGTGAEAVTKLQNHPYSLVFMDCQMPEMNGFDATRAIRKGEATTGKHVPVIAMTAHAVEGNREQCLAAGMDDFISKPIDSQRLEIMLNKWLPPVQGAEISSHSALPAPITLDEKFGKDEARRLRAIFVEDASKELKKLNQALANKNRRKLIEISHGLKGDCLIVDATELYELCQELELAAKAKAWDSAMALAIRLKSAFLDLEEQSRLETGQAFPD